MALPADLDPVPALITYGPPAKVQPDVRRPAGPGTRPKGLTPPAAQAARRVGRLPPNGPPPWLMRYAGGSEGPAGSGGDAATEPPIAAPPAARQEHR